MDQALKFLLRHRRPDCPDIPPIIWLHARAVNNPLPLPLLQRIPPILRLLLIRIRISPVYASTNWRPIPLPLAPHTRHPQPLLPTTLLQRSPIDPPILRPIPRERLRRRAQRRMPPAEGQALPVRLRRCRLRRRQRRRRRLDVVVLLADDGLLCVLGVEHGWQAGRQAAGRRALHLGGRGCVSARARLMRCRVRACGSAGGREVT